MEGGLLKQVTEGGRPLEPNCLYFDFQSKLTTFVKIIIFNYLN